jgi:hypothetical protein
MHDTYLERLEDVKILSGTSGQEEQAGSSSGEDILTTARNQSSKGRREYGMSYTKSSILQTLSYMS